MENKIQVLMRNYEGKTLKEYFFTEEQIKLIEMLKKDGLMGGTGYRVPSKEPLKPEDKLDFEEGWHRLENKKSLQPSVNQEVSIIIRFYEMVPEKYVDRWWKKELDHYETTGFRKENGYWYINRNGRTENCKILAWKEI